MFFYAFPITNNRKNANFGVKQLKKITAMKQTLSILLLLCLAMPLQAQSVLTGNVRSAESRQPVEFANVALFRSDSLLVGGTLYWKSRVIYSGELDWGGKGQDSIPIKIQRFHPSQTNEYMITEVKACHIKD